MGVLDSELPENVNHNINKAMWFCCSTGSTTCSENVVCSSKCSRPCRKMMHDTMKGRVGSKQIRAHAHLNTLWLWCLFYLVQYPFGILDNNGGESIKPSPWLVHVFFWFWDIWHQASRYLCLRCERSLQWWTWLYIHITSHFLACPSLPGALLHSQTFIWYVACCTQSELGPKLVWGVSTWTGE